MGPLDCHLKAGCGMAPIQTPHGENKLKILKREQILWTLMCKLSSRCASFVGCRGGVQPIYLSDSCSVGNLCHEVIHTLGLHHEHTRVDRDRYITVQWQNILPGRASTNTSSPHDGNLHWGVCNFFFFFFFGLEGNKNNFKVKRANTLNLPYDLSSIMHYGPWVLTHSCSRQRQVYRFTVMEKKQNKCCCFVAGTFLAMIDVRRYWPSRAGRRWVRGHTSPSWISRNWTDSTTVVPHRLCFSTQWFLLSSFYLWMWCLQN